MMDVLFPQPPTAPAPDHKRPPRGWRRVFRAVAPLLLMLGSFVFAAAESKLMVVSDLHYLAPRLYEDSDLFLRVLQNADGKIPQHGEILLSALLRQVQYEQPDALIVTGDLTFNGEKESHLALAEWFRKIEKTGVPVWVIPGNHDIRTVNPLGFADEIWYGVGSVSPQEFGDIYADFMNPGDEGFTNPEDIGFSYTVQVSDDLQVAMTDVSVYQERAETFGVFTAPHAAWLENALSGAKDAGVRVITATHHSLVSHTEFAKENYLMFGNERMAELAVKYDVPLNLSGHLHIQHIARNGPLADAALGAFCIWPHRYALVTCSDSRQLVYEAKALKDTFLPEGFLPFSREWFLKIARNKTLASLSGSDEDIRQLADYVARFNLAYFSGTYRQEDPSWTEDPAYALWQKQSGSALWETLRLLMNEPAGDRLHWKE